ncbi:unnamed protein product, partial [Meganyctiphanes norvegica]
MSWDEAESKCDWYSARLATVRDAHTLKHYIDSYFSKANFWIGGKIQEDKGTWGWISGEEVNSSFPWVLQDHGEQQPTEDNQNCMVLKYLPDKSQHEFVAEICDKKSHYICEVHKIKLDRWRWVSDLPVEPSFPWGGYNDGSQHHTDTEEHRCMALRSSEHHNLYHYVGSRCNETFRYVCEASQMIHGDQHMNRRNGKTMRENIQNMNAIDAHLLMDIYYEDDEKECQDDLFVFSFENKCYKIDELKNPCDPCNECPSKGYALAQPERPDLLWQFIEESGNYPYIQKNHMSYAGPLVIGGRGNGRDFVWDNGSVIHSSWWEREPRSVKNINCLVMGSHRSKTAILKSQLCRDNFIVLCEQTGSVEDSDSSDDYDYYDYDDESDYNEDGPSESTSDTIGNSYSRAGSSGIKPGESQKGSCEDSTTDCLSWESYCAGNSAVRNKCPKTCKTCVASATDVCEDSDPNCKHWKTYCDSNTTVKGKCKATCGVCQPSPSTG